MCWQREFRRVLSNNGVRTQRRIAIALLDSLREKEPMRKASSRAPSTPASAPTGAFSLVKAPGVATIATAGPDAASRVAAVQSVAAPPAAAAPSPDDEDFLLISTLETALRSELLSADKDRTVSEKLRDQLVDQGRKVQEIFRERDVDGDGEIARDEFRAGISRLGVKASTGQINALFDEFDGNGGA